MTDSTPSARAGVSRRLKRVARDWLPPVAHRGLKSARPQRPDPLEASTEMDLVKKAFAANDLEAAAARVEGVLVDRPKDPRVLRVAARIEARRGRFVDAQTFIQEAAENSNDILDQFAARNLTGRVRETDPAWCPTVVGQAPAPPTEKRALYLAKESRPFLSNGFSTRTHETLAGLGASGREVIGVTMPGFPSVIGIERAPHRSEVEGVTYDHVMPDAGPALKRLGFDEYLQVSTQALAAEVSRIRPDLLHVGSGHRGYETALIGAALADWAKIPFLYEVRSFFETTWTVDDRYMATAPYYQRRFDTETRVMRRADAVVTLSGPMRDELIHEHGVPEDSLYVVPNAVDTSRFTPQPRDEVLRAELGLGSSFTVGYVSNLSHPREGQEVLIEAVALLAGQGHDVNCLLVGEGSRLEELKDLAVQRGIAGRVVFTGGVPFHDVAAYYSQIDLFVVPRIDERAARLVSPMKPFEAMAMRVPLLMSHLPALVEITDGGRIARTFAPGDAADLARMIRLMSEAPEDLARLVDLAEEWVKRERTWARAAELFGAVYDELRARAAETRR